MVRIHTTAIGPGGEMVDLVKVEIGPTGEAIGRINLSKDGIRDFRGGFVTVTTSPIELLSGPTRLENSHTLAIVNDSSNLLYLRVGDHPDLVNGNFLILFSGELITFEIDKHSPISIFAVTDESTARIRVIEVA